jgi:hypothetical protein
MNNDSLLKSGTMALLAGVSISVVFAATGFIAAFGREQFLGVNLSDWSAQTLTILAGRCVADSFFLGLNLAARHGVLVGVLLVLTGLAVVVLRRCTLPAWAAPSAECLIAIPILIWLLVTIVNFEGPTIAMRGWVLSPVGTDHQFESPLTTAIRELHPGLSKESVNSYQSSKSPQEYVKSAISQGAEPPASAAPATGLPDPPTRTSASPGVTRLPSYYFGSQFDGPGALLLETSSQQVAHELHAIGFPIHNRNEARNLLYSRYARAVAVCFIAALFLLLSSQRPEVKIWCDLLSVLRTGVIAGAGIATLLLPYVYGKLIDSTLFPDCHITYTAPSTDAPDGKGQMVSGEFPVMSRTDKAVSLLWVQRTSGATQIIEVPVDKIVKLEYAADVDALAKIAHCVEANTEEGLDCQ